jgi:hypothetical protein
MQASGAVPLPPEGFGARPALSPIALLPAKIETAKNITNKMFLCMTASFSVHPTVSERHTSFQKS